MECSDATGVVYCYGVSIIYTAVFPRVGRWGLVYHIVTILDSDC